MNPKQFDELKASVKQGGILHDLEAEYDELVRLRDENKRLRNAIVLAVYYMKLDNRYMVFKCLINALDDEVTHD